MYTKCQYCGEYAVDDTEAIEVCKSCGVVGEELTFSCTDYITVSKSTFTPFSKSEPRLNHRKKKPLTLQHGQSVIDNLCHFNSIPSVLKTQATELFKLLLTMKKYRRKEDAGTAAACCLLLLLRKNKQAIAINTLCKQTPCTKGKFSYFLKFLKSTIKSNAEFKEYSYLLDYDTCDFQENIEHDVLSIVPSLIREICEKADAKEKAQLMEKTASLVKLANSCWLLTGRSPRSIVAASAFLCWKSMHPSRKKASFSKFCANLEIREQIALLRIPELKAMLLKLGKMLPSRKENYVNENNLLFHLNDILGHSETLRNDLFPNACTSEEVDAVEFASFRLPPISNPPRQEPLDAVNYESDMNASDIEISDSEIESYLVSNKKEVIEFCEKNNLQADNLFS